jgi:hypothetical protein
MLADLLTDLKERTMTWITRALKRLRWIQLFSNIYDKKVKEDDFDVD